jgi:pyruvate/2-oxoglutarate dehydrogenase complex dihydrolipoamide dehydrogenase (E3) component
MVEGHAQFASANAIEVGGETLEADQFFIDVGARPAPRISQASTRSAR